MQQLRQLLKQREDEQAGVRLPNTRTAPLDELRRQHEQQPRQRQDQLPRQQEAWSSEPSNAGDPYARAYVPSPISTVPPAERVQRSERQELPAPTLRDRPGSASAVRLAVLSAQHDPRRRASPHVA